MIKICREKKCEAKTGLVGVQMLWRPLIND